MLYWAIIYQHLIDSKAPSQYKEGLSRCQDFHYKDKMVMRLSYCYNLIPILLRQNLYIEMRCRALIWYKDCLTNIITLWQMVVRSSYLHKNSYTRKTACLYQTSPQVPYCTYFRTNWPKILINWFWPAFPTTHALHNHPSCWKRYERHSAMHHMWHLK